MRTTVDIRGELLRQAKKKAASDGTTLREVIEAALTSYLSGKPKKSGYRLRWTTDSGMLLPGVDLEDRDALFDLMDRKP
jgi:hypothetical protein